MHKIGQLKVTAVKGYHRHFEYAGAGELWDLEESMVDVAFNGYWAIYSHPGVCTESWFQNRIGATLGSANLCTDPKPGKLPRQISMFDLGQLYVDGHLELGLEWEAYYCDGSYADGTPIVCIQPKK